MYMYLMKEYIFMMADRPRPNIDRRFAFRLVIDPCLVIYYHTHVFNHQRRGLRVERVESLETERVRPTPSEPASHPAPIVLWKALKERRVSLIRRTSNNLLSLAPGIGTRSCTSFNT